MVVTRIYTIQVSMFDEHGLGNFLVYHIVPILASIIYLIIRRNRSFLGYLKFILICFVSIAWWVSTIAPQIYLFAFTEDNFSIFYLIFGWALAAIILYIYEKYEIQDVEYLSDQQRRVSAFKVGETYLLCYLMGLGITFIKEVYVMSGTIEISELVLMMRQAGEYKGNSMLIFDFLGRYSYNNILMCLLFVPILVGIHKRFPKYSIRFISLFYFLAISRILFTVVKPDAVTNDDWFSENAIFPTLDVIKSPEKFKNIIMYQMESMDNGLSSKKVGGKNDFSRIPNLENLIFEDDVIHFTHKWKGTLGGLQQTKYTRLTTSSTLGTLCSIPFFGRNSGKTGSNPSDYYVNYNCLTDILDQLGYIITVTYPTTYYDYGIGSVFDYHKCKDVTSNPTNAGWAYDRVMMPIFMANINKSLGKGKPFFAHYMTIDSHQPGRVCPDCPDDEDRHFRSYRCSDKRVKDFLDWAKKQSWYKDTVIVIYGDHLYRSGDIANVIEKRVYNAFLNTGLKPGLNKTTYRNATNFDIYPTILHAAGFTIPRDRLGIGTNLFSDSPTLLEKFGLDTFELEGNGATIWYSKNVLHTMLGGAEPVVTGKLYVE